MPFYNRHDMRIKSTQSLLKSIRQLQIINREIYLICKQLRAIKDTINETNIQIKTFESSKTTENYHIFPSVYYTMNDISVRFPLVYKKFCKIEYCINTQKELMNRYLFGIQSINDGYHDEMYDQIKIKKEKYCSLEIEVLFPDIYHKFNYLDLKKIERVRLMNREILLITDRIY